MAKKPTGPRTIGGDMVDALKTVTAKWTRQRKSEERHPGNVRYRVSRMTKEPTVKQKHVAWEVMEECYLAASGSRRLPARRGKSTTRHARRSWRGQTTSSWRMATFPKPCCPTTSKNILKPRVGTWFMTPADISKNRTPTATLA